MAIAGYRAYIRRAYICTEGGYKLFLDDWATDQPSADARPTACAVYNDRWKAPNVGPRRTHHVASPPGYIRPCVRLSVCVDHQDARTETSTFLTIDLYDISIILATDDPTALTRKLQIAKSQQRVINGVFTRSSKRPANIQLAWWNPAAYQLWAKQ